jgi:TRAM domain
VVRVSHPKQLAVGDWAEVRITQASDYDLEAKLHQRGD